MNLVANRECGTCTVCCKILAIDDVELQKLPGIMCPNCKADAGCQIYETRPATCRGFYCGWRYLPNLGDDWRPDRCGIMIRHQRDQIPPGYKVSGLRFLVFDRADALFRPGFVEYLGALTEHGVPLFLSMRGPDGYSDGTLFINDHLAPAVARRDRDACVKILNAALDALRGNKFEPAVLKHGNPRLPG